MRSSSLFSLGLVILATYSIARGAPTVCVAKPSAPARQAALASQSAIEAAHRQSEQIDTESVRIRRQVMDFNPRTPEVVQADQRLNQLQSEQSRIGQEKLTTTAEMRSGLYCNRCWRSKSEIERGGENFYAHLQEVHGQAVPAPEDKIQEKEREYDQRWLQLGQIEAAAQQRAAAARRATEQLNQLNAEIVRNQAQYMSVQQQIAKQVQAKVAAEQEADRLERGERWCALRQEQERREEAKRLLLEKERQQRELAREAAERRQREEELKRQQERSRTDQLVAEARDLQRQLQELEDQRLRRADEAAEARRNYDSIVVQQGVSERRAADERDQHLRDIEKDLNDFQRGSMEDLLRREKDFRSAESSHDTSPDDPEQRVNEDLSGRLESAAGGSGGLFSAARRWADDNRSAIQIRLEKTLLSAAPSSIPEISDPPASWKEYVNRVVGGLVKEGLGSARATIIEGDTTIELSPTEKAYRNLFDTSRKIDVPMKYLPRLMNAASQFFGLALPQFDNPPEGQQ